MLPILLLLVLLLHYGSGLRWPNFPRWCRRDAADYGCWCCYYTTGRVYAAQILPVGVGVMLPILLLLVLLLQLRVGSMLPKFSPLV